MSALTLTDVRPWGGDAVDLLIADGVIAAVTPAGTALVSGDRVDGQGLLALPGFVNAHAHVDKSWWGQPWVSYGGEATTQGRIAHERAERDKYGIPSAAGATAVLREFLRHGTTATRSHVDVDPGSGLRGIEAVREAVAALDDAIEVEIVAFPQDGVIRRPGVLELLDDAAQAGATSIGGLDPASIDRDPVAQLDGLFEIAERRGVGLDIHLHDGGDLGAFQYELIIERTLRTGLAGQGERLPRLRPRRAVRRPGRPSWSNGWARPGISWTTVAPVGSAPLPWRARCVRRASRRASAPTASATCGRRTVTATCCAWPGFRPAARPAHGPGPDQGGAAGTTEAVGFVHRERHDLVPGHARTSCCWTPRTSRTPWSGCRGDGWSSPAAGWWCATANC